MATRWMRWNPATHIFEYSTDGVLFNILPLNASIINEGTLDIARLPAGLPSLSADNVFTGAAPITLSSPTPNLTFYETDQGVDLKRSRFIVESGALSFQTINDAGNALLSSPFAIGRAGGIVSASTVSHSFTINRAGASSFAISNPDAGTGTHLDFVLANNLGNRFYIRAYSSNFANICELASLAAGLNIVTSSGDMNFFTGGAKRATLDAAGNLIVFSGYVYANAGIVEFGRSALMGHWKDVPFSTGYFGAAAGAWNVAAGNVQTFKYALVGKTMHLIFSCSLTTVTAATSYIILNLPDGLKPNAAFSYQSPIYNGTSGWTTGYTAFVANSGAIWIYGNPGAGAWPASSANVYVNLNVAFSIA
jgi:hypothetical protein